MAKAKAFYAFGLTASQLQRQLETMPGWIQEQASKSTAGFPWPQEPLSIRLVLSITGGKRQLVQLAIWLERLLDKRETLRVIRSSPLASSGRSPGRKLR